MKSKSLKIVSLIVLVAFSFSVIGPEFALAYPSSNTIRAADTKTSRLAEDLQHDLREGIASSSRFAEDITIQSYHRKVRRPKRPDKVKKACGVRFFKGCITPLGVSQNGWSDFVLGLVLAKHVMAKIEELTILSPMHFPEAFAYIRCQLYTVPDTGEKVLIIKNIQSEIFSKLIELKKAGAGTPVESQTASIIDQYQDWAQVLVLAVHELAEQLMVERVFYIDSFWQKKRCRNPYDAFFPLELIEHLYTDLPQNMRYERWLGIGHDSGEKIVLVLDGIQMNSGWVRKVPGELSDADKVFRKYALEDSEENIAEDISTDTPDVKKPDRAEHSDAESGRFAEGWSVNRPSYIFLDADNFLWEGTTELARQIFAEIYWLAKNKVDASVDREFTDEELAEGMEFIVSIPARPQDTYFQAVRDRIIKINGEAPVNTEDDYIKYFERRYRNLLCVRLKKGTEEYLKRLVQKREEGYEIHIYIVSHGSQFEVDLISEALGIAGYFVGKYGARWKTGGYHKADKIREIIAGKGDIFIAMGGDGLGDMQTGAEVNAACFATPTGSATREKLIGNGAGLVTNSLDEVDAIFSFFDNPQDAVNRFAEGEDAGASRFVESNVLYQAAERTIVEKIGHGEPFTLQEFLEVFDKTDVCHNRDICTNGHRISNNTAWRFMQQLIESGVVREISSEEMKNPHHYKYTHCHAKDLEHMQRGLVRGRENINTFTDELKEADIINEAAAARIRNAMGAVVSVMVGKLIIQPHKNYDDISESVNSGIVFHKDREYYYILTAAHGVQNQDVVFINIGEITNVECEVIKSEIDETPGKRIDLAILRVPVESLADIDIPEIELSDSQARGIGKSRVIVLGEIDPHLPSRAPVMSYSPAGRFLQEPSLLYLDVGLGPGFSGISVFDTEGKLFGVVNGGLVASDFGCGAACYGKQLIDFLERNMPASFSNESRFAEELGRVNKAELERTYPRYINESP